CASGNPWFAYW
nr:immunoglobulin heavy chain junction region [Mus musculus]